MLITIVTPTYNALEFLRPCLESVRMNVEPGVEIDHVICDGGSTDGTVEFARRFGARVICEKDDGIFDAINKGSWNSSGELLGFLGGDDALLPGAMRRVVEAYRAGGRRWVVGGIHWIDERDRYIGGLAAPPLWMTPRMMASLGWNPVMNMATFFSREFFQELGGYDIAYRYSGDYEMMLRARLMEPYTRITHPLACFRRTGVNASVVGGMRMEAENLAIRRQFGPASAIERRMWALLLKGWFNARNPDWLLYKTTAPLRMALGLQEKAHF